MLPSKLAFVDVETTGARSFYDRIIEIGILRVEDGEIVSTYNTLINPETRIPPEIETLTGIKAADVEHAPTFRSIKHDILEQLIDCVFVAHNVRFDYSFLRGEFAREEINFSSKHFCTVKLSRYLFPEHRHHNLDAIIERFNFSITNRHRAFDDAKILFDFYKKVQTFFPSEAFEKAVNLALRRPSLPTKLSTEDLDNIPEQPGVYIFYGEDNTPLYIGKSINLRDRVLSHFSADIYSSIEMKISQQITRVETRVCAGELGALLTESQLIKSMLPIYNRKLRLKRELTALRSMTDANGYHTLALETISNITPDDFPTLLGFFKSKKQAKDFLSNLTKEYMLCEKLLGLEKTSTACFSYRLGSCKGACVKEEAPLMYNLRFLTAVTKNKIQPWPFPSAILIRETNQLSGKKEYFLVDKWCFLGSIQDDSSNDLSDLLTKKYLFDLDVYKIIRSFIKNPQNQKRITVLKPQGIQKAMSFEQFSPAV